MLLFFELADGDGGKGGFHGYIRLVTGKEGTLWGLPRNSRLSDGLKRRELNRPTTGMAKPTWFNDRAGGHSLTGLWTAFLLSCSLEFASCKAPQLLNQFTHAI